MYVPFPPVGFAVQVTEPPIAVLSGETEQEADKTETEAEHEAVEPPLEPVHDQDQGPEPETEEAEPAEQRLLVGADETLVPLAEPQEPFVLTSEHDAALPPLEPLHVQVYEFAPLTLFALVPAEQL